MTPSASLGIARQRSRSFRSAPKGNGYRYREKVWHPSAPAPAISCLALPRRYTDKIMHRASLALIRFSLAFFLLCSAAGAGLPRSTPEAQGISSAVIRDYVETADRQVNTMHSFMLVRHGHVVAEAWWSPEAADKPHVLWSLSKSFTSTAVGLAVAEGKLSIDDPVLKFFPDDAPAEPSANLRAMRLSD